MLTRPFLTELDSERLKLKGSRDPLGIQPVWVRFGRHVVGNLTTVSNAARDFTVTLLGYHFAEQVAETAPPGSELGTFLKWEQLAGYARHAVNRETGFRGTERVGRNLESGTVTLSTQPRDQILSNQKITGLWGLYTVPGRSSGLLEGEPVRLTPAARELVEDAYLPQLRAAGFRDGTRIVELLSRDRARLDTRGDHRRLLAAVAGLIAPSYSARERAFYREHLLHGGPGDPTQQRQRQLVELLEPGFADARFSWSPRVVRALAREAERRGAAWQPLADRLWRIAAAETLLAPASALFAHLQGCDRFTRAEVAKRLRQAWGGKVTTVAVGEMPALEAELGGGDAATGRRWLAIAQGLAEGNYEDVVGRLLEQNREVMRQRDGAAAWIEEENGRLLVRMPEERGELPARDELAELWRFTYFLEALRSVGSALQGRAA